MSLVGHIFNALVSIIILTVWLSLVKDFGKWTYERLAAPKHRLCGSRWRVRKIAYYYDVPLYRCRRRSCEMKVTDFFMASTDDGDLLQDHMLADEAKNGPMTVERFWRHINSRPETHA